MALDQTNNASDKTAPIVGDAPPTAMNTIAVESQVGLSGLQQNSGSDAASLKALGFPSGDNLLAGFNNDINTLLTSGNTSEINAGISLLNKEASSFSPQTASGDGPVAQSPQQSNPDAVASVPPFDNPLAAPLADGPLTAPPVEGLVTAPPVDGLVTAPPVEAPVQAGQPAPTNPYINYGSATTQPMSDTTPAPAPSDTGAGPQSPASLDVQTTGNASLDTAAINAAVEAAGQPTAMGTATEQTATAFYGTSAVAKMQALGATPDQIANFVNNISTTVLPELNKPEGSTIPYGSDGSNTNDIWVAGSQASGSTLQQFENSWYTNLTSTVNENLQQGGVGPVAFSPTPPSDTGSITTGLTSGASTSQVLATADSIAQSTLRATEPAGSTQAEMSASQFYGTAAVSDMEALGASASQIASYLSSFTPQLDQVLDQPEHTAGDIGRDGFNTNPLWEGLNQVATSGNVPTTLAGFEAAGTQAIDTSLQQDLSESGQTLVGF